MAQERTTSRRTLRNRPARHGDEREQALLETAERLLNEGVFDSTSLAEIAAVSGVSRPGFYFYFASKDALLSTLIVRTLDALASGLSHGAEAGDVVDPVEALRAALIGGADLWYEHRAVLMAASEFGSHDSDVFDRVVAAQAALIKPTSELLAQGARVGSDHDADSLAEMFTWMAERNFYVLSRKRPSREELHAMAGRLLDVWVAAAGLSPDARHRSAAKSSNRQLGGLDG